MNERQRRIIAIMSHNMADQMITSASLAKNLGVTARTIKTDMIVVAEELANNGAQLISKRNHGYTFKIIDERIFSRYIVKINLNVDENVEKLSTEYEMRIQIARKMIGSETGVKIDDIAKSLNYTRSAIGDMVKWTDNFIESFGLVVSFSPKYGKLVTGLEQMKRLCMVELIATHYHKTDVNENTVSEYARWFACADERKKEIRHTFLKTLRESRFSFRDSNTQRVAMYLIAALNRHKAGYCIELDKQYKKELKNLEILSLVQAIFKALGPDYDELANDENEVFFLESLFLSYLDIHSTNFDDKTIKLVEKEFSLAYSEVKRTLDNHGLRLEKEDCRLLETALLPLLFEKKYHFDGFDSFNYPFEALYLSSPIDVYYAQEIVDALQRTIGYKSNRTNIALLGNWVQCILVKNQYPIKKLRLLSTGAFGADYASIEADKIMERYSDLIEFILPIELYEYRRMEKENFDGFLVDMIYDENKFMDYSGYNYTLPAVSASVYLAERDELRIYNDLLINAYQYKPYLIDANKIKVIHNYRYSNIEQTVQLLSLLHGKDAASANMLYEKIISRNENKAMIFKSTAVILCVNVYCKDEAFELYCLESVGTWKGRKFNQLIFCNVSFKNTIEIKVAEALLRCLTSDPDEFILFKKDPEGSMEHIIRKTLRKN